MLELEQRMLDRLGQSWYEQLENCIISDEFDNIISRLTIESETNIIYPPANVAFEAFRLCPYDNTKVVILGMDPYHDGSANGLAFSTNGMKFTPSIRIILDRMKLELGQRYIRTTNFTDIARQGVLLLNTSLSVIKKKPGSHIELWKPFTQAVIAALRQKPYLVWMLWGKHANDIAIDLPSNHTVLSTIHPAAQIYDNTREFEPRFDLVNEYLIKHGFNPIEWYDQDDDLPF